MEKLISEFSIGLFMWQSIVFVALILLLRKFAWKPILNAVSDREEKIQSALDAIEKRVDYLGHVGKVIRQNF